MREMKTRWILAIGYPYADNHNGVGIRIFKDRDGMMEIGAGKRIPKSALSGKDKYRLVLEKVMPGES